LVDVGGRSIKLQEKEKAGELVLDLTAKDKPRVLKCNGCPLVPLKEVGSGAKVL
jgi:hypothetical protein